MNSKNKNAMTLLIWLWFLFLWIIILINFTLKEERELCNDERMTLNGVCL